MKRSLTLLALACIGLGATSALATTSLLSGNLLVIKNKLPDDETKNRIVCLATGGQVTSPTAGGSGDPTCGAAGGGGGSITFSSATSGQSFTSPLPCANWRAAKNGGYRYLDRQLDQGACKLVIIKQGKILKTLCQGTGPTDLNYDLMPGQSQTPVNVSLRVGSGPDLYCMSFGGKVLKSGDDGRTFLAKQAPAPVLQCSPSGAFLDGPQQS